MRGPITCLRPAPDETSREEPVSSQRLRMCLTAVASAALLSACGGGEAPGAKDEPTNILGYKEGIAPVEEISLVEALGLYVLAPAVILLVVAGLVWLPGMVRNSRYRPGRGWTAAPLWFGGPPDPVAAVENADTGELVRGGASGDW